LWASTLQPQVGGPAGAKNSDTVNFADYDVVVVGCSDGCGLTQGEIDTLIQRTNDVVQYVNSGGGLVAFEESDLQRQFAFLPSLNPSANAFQGEQDFRATSFGKSIGLTDQDVSANISHNILPNRLDLESWMQMVRAVL